MVELSIQLPDDVALAFGATREAQGQRVLEDAAVEEYRSGRLSHRQVGEALGLDYWKTEEFLSSRGVSLSYNLEDLEQDRATLEAIIPKK